ncbi:MAG: ABC transporter permease [Coriobacteriales bacterium]
MPRPYNPVLCMLFAIVFVLAGWELTALLLDTPALPTPQDTVPILARFAPELAPGFAVSFYRVAVSLAIGVCLGLPVGLALGRSPRLDALFAPVLYILYPLPKIVLLPILLVLLGLADAPKIALISLTVFFQVVVVMRDAAKAIPQATLLSVRSLGAGRWDEWRHVVLPATLPELFTTLRVSSAVAIAVLFFAEAIAGSTGLGYFIMESWAMVNYPRMFAGIIALAALGVIVYELFDLLEHRATRWRRSV